MRVLIAGSSGFIGTALTERLRGDGAEVRRLVRGVASGPDEVPWTPGGALNPAELDGVDAIVNLAGASISQMPWTAKRRSDILHSRLAAAGTLVAALKANPGPALINASAVGYYGSRGDEALTEQSGPGTGFLAEVCQQWEAAALEASDVARVVLVRTGLVIGNGGAIVPLRALMTAGMGGKLGNGRQWWPWISLTDEVAAISHLVRSNEFGAFNLAGPTPASMAGIGRTLSRMMYRPFWLPAPEFALKLVLGEAGEELLLASQKMVPERLVASGFRFQHSTAEQALRALFPGN